MAKDLEEEKKIVLCFSLFFFLPMHVMFSSLLEMEAFCCFFWFAPAVIHQQVAPSDHTVDWQPSFLHRIRPPHWPIWVGFELEKKDMWIGESDCSSLFGLLKKIDFLITKENIYIYI